MKHKKLVDFLEMMLVLREKQPEIYKEFRKEMQKTK